MTILAPFEGPRLKLRLAQKHIADLRQLVAEFAQSAKLEMVEVGRNGSRVRYELRSTAVPPDEAPAVIGDAIHNLRSSLDLMICDLARIRETSADKLKFPFAENSEKLDKILTKDLARLGPDVIAGIKSLRPYKGGNLALRALHDLDIRDKHETVLPYFLVAWVGMKAPQASLDLVQREIGIDLSQLPFAVASGYGMEVDEGSDPWGMITPVPGGPYLTFDRSLPLAGEPVLEALDGLAELANEIIDSFFREFGGGNGNANIAP